MELALIMTELVKIRILLSALIGILGLLLVAALIVGGIYCSRRMDRMLDNIIKEETGP